MLEEILKAIADILSGDKPDPDVLGPEDIKRILGRRRKSK